MVAAAERYLPAKKSPKGLRPGEFVEAFVVLSALGGECLDDLDRLRRDRGLAALLGYALPAASTARQYLDRAFHDPEAVKGRPAQGSFIPAESAGLSGLREVVRHYSELNEDRLHADGERILKPLRLDAGETDDLIAFLSTLSDTAPPFRRRADTCP